MMSIVLFIVSCRLNKQEKVNPHRQKTSDSITLAKIYENSDFWYKNNKLDSSLYYDKSLLKKANDASNHYYQARANLNIALFFNSKATYDSAYYHFNQAKNHFLATHDTVQAGAQLMSMALIQKNQNDFFGSKETLVEALKYLQVGHDKKYVASCYNALATNHRKLLNYEDATNYYLKAITLAVSPKDRLAYKNNLAVTYIDAKAYTRAKDLFLNILKDSTLNKQSSQYARVLDNLAYAQWRSGEKIDDEAFAHPLRLRKRNNDQRGSIASYTHLGEYHAKNWPQKARKYFDTVIQLSKTLKIPRAEKDALTFLMALAPKNVGLRNRYITLQDSLAFQATKVKTQFAKYKYDDQINREERLRLEKENAERTLEANAQRTEKIYYLSGLLFVVTVLGLSYYGFAQRTRRLRQEKKTAALSAVHETEAELSRRLHDDFGGRLNSTMMLLQNNAEIAEVLDVVEGLYQQSRDLSREINVVDAGSNFKNELIEMLRFRTPEHVKLYPTRISDISWDAYSPLTKTTLFKVLQELMINMTKHSGASFVGLEFKETPKTLNVVYIDDGVGVPMEHLKHKNGLRNTEKRIEAIGGSITFESEKENGFRARIVVPK